MIKPCEDYEAIAGSFFSLPEVQVLLSLPSSLQIYTFLDFWTRKEAFSKAMGAGLGLDWSTFDVCPVPPQRVRMINHGPCKLSVQSFTPAAGYIGAVAFEGWNPALKFWRWPGFAFSSRPARVGEYGSSLTENPAPAVSSKEAMG